VTVRFGSFELDSARRQLFRNGDVIHLTPKAFELLCFLIEAAPRVLRKVELHERLWPNGVVSDATLVGLVKEIRRALGDRDRNAPIVRTVHRVGYAFNAPIASASQHSNVSRWLIAGERRIALVPGENVIGRDPDANVCLDYSTVSRRHARLLVSDASTVLEDLGSKNGTTIDGTRLTAAVTLRNGDRFSCGHVLMTYRESTASVPTVTQVSRVGDERSTR
jgi:DNA-binding winged helix-turn-helix (wHTH) protein